MPKFNAPVKPQGMEPIDQIIMGMFAVMGVFIFIFVIWQVYTAGYNAGHEDMFNTYVDTYHLSGKDPS